VALTDQNAVFAEHWEVLNCYILSAVDFQDGSLDEKEKAEIRSWSIFSASALSTIPGRPPCFYSYSIARFPNPGKHRNVSNKKVLGNQEMEFMCEKKGNLDEDSHLFNCSNCVWLDSYFCNLLMLSWNKNVSWGCLYVVVVKVYFTFNLLSSADSFHAFLSSLSTITRIAELRPAPVLLVCLSTQCSANQYLPCASCVRQSQQ
jgi:hypothetical protein